MCFVVAVGPSRPSGPQSSSQLLGDRNDHVVRLTNFVPLAAALRVAARCSVSPVFDL